MRDLASFSDLLFEADPIFSHPARAALAIPCDLCGAEPDSPCFHDAAQGLPGFHHRRLALAEGRVRA